jgi:hypothetical protein
LKQKVKILGLTVLTLLSINSYSQTQSSSGNIGVDTIKPKGKSPVVVAVEASKYLYSNQTPDRDNVTAYVGYKKLWWEGAFLTDQRQTVGYYIPKGLVWARWRPGDVQAFVNRNVFTSKGFISAVNVTYQRIHRTDVTVNRTIELAGIEMEKYINDNNYLILSVRKEWGRRNDVIAIATYDYKSNGQFRLRLGGGINSFGDLNAFTVVTVNSHFYLVGTYFEKFDYNTYNRGSFGIGFKL